MIARVFGGGPVVLVVLAVMSIVATLTKPCWTAGSSFSRLKYKPEGISRSSPALAAAIAS